MEHRILAAKQTAAYTTFLRSEERAAATVEKYTRDVLAFAAWLGGRPVTKETVTQWKERLLEDGLSPATVNTKLAAVNGLLRFLGWGVSGQIRQGAEASLPGCCAGSQPRGIPASAHCRSGAGAGAAGAFA